jgi:hypothetical protein
MREILPFRAKGSEEIVEFPNERNIVQGMTKRGVNDLRSIEQWI